MKRVNKWVRRSIAVLGVLSAGLWVLCLDGVDYRPYLKQPYSAETMARFQASAATNQIVRGTLEAGFGRARLTPDLGAAVQDAENGRFPTLPLSGYGDREGRPATGVHDDLFVKAVALRVAGKVGIMFGADALIVPREVADLAAEQISQELGIGRPQLYFSATHTHCGLGGWGEGWVGEAFSGPFNPGVRTWFASRFLAAAREAMADLQPAEFGHGSFDAPEFVRNRLAGELGQVDSEFSYAVIKQTGSRTAILGSYSAHATVLSGKVMEFSGDYPGYWQQTIEREIGGPTVFLAGCVGSHAPVPGAPGFEGAERMGEALARLALKKISETALTNTISFGLIGLDVSLPPLSTRLTDGVRLRPWISARLLPRMQPSFLQTFRLEKMLWVSTPCDFSGELALDIKNAFRLRGYHTTITSFNGDYIGYVVPARYYHWDGYETRTMSFYGPNVPDYLDELIRKMGMHLATDTVPPKKEVAE